MHALMLEVSGDASEVQGYCDQVVGLLTDQGQGWFQQSILFPASCFKHSKTYIYI